MFVLELVCLCSSSLLVLVPFIVFVFGLVLVLVLVCRLLSFFVVVLVLVSRVGVARCPLVDRTRWDSCRPGGPEVWRKSRWLL